MIAYAREMGLKRALIDPGFSLDILSLSMLEQWVILDIDR